MVAVSILEIKERTEAGGWIFSFIIELALMLKFMCLLVDYTNHHHAKTFCM